jgi:large subunit ribosomal protein L23
MAKEEIKFKSVLKKPRITEKAAISADKNNAYVFNVEKSATKKSIALSIKNQYKVTPIRVNVTKISDKSIVFRGKRGVKHGGKKAYVFLKKGDKIEII